VCGVCSVGGSGRWLDGLCGEALQCSVADDAAASFIHATPTAAERGQFPEREAPWAEQEVLAGSPAGRTSTITTRQKFLRADPGLEAVERGWNRFRPSALAATPRAALRGHAPHGYDGVEVGHLWSPRFGGCSGVRK
jgi:hypothetical protein